MHPIGSRGISRISLQQRIPLIPNCIRLACVLAERLRSAPEASGLNRGLWPTLPDSASDPEPPHRRAPAPAPALAPARS
eukprot:6176661-Pleurochrysis_carterae.AAC.1